MRRRLSIFVLLGLMAATAGCSTGDAKKNAPTYKLPEAGTLHDNIQGFTARDISYALYLPKKFIPGGTTAGSGQGNTLKAGIRRWPVIVAFDPHGAGAIPVKKYMELADRYGFILIGSNNSKNGLPVNETWAIVSALITEVLAVYPVDTSSFCMAGFSGGSGSASRRDGFTKCHGRSPRGCPGPLRRSGPGSPRRSSRAGVGLRGLRPHG